MGILSGIGRLLFVQNDRKQAGKAMANLDYEEAEVIKEVRHSHMSGNIKYRDPVCSMWVLPDDAKASTNYNGEDYYFCSQSCIDKFNAGPEKYVKQFDSSENMNMDSMRKRGRRHGGCC